jgi:hypothetical protein
MRRIPAHLRMPCAASAALVTSVTVLVTAVGLPSRVGGERASATVAAAAAAPAVSLHPQASRARARVPAPKPVPVRPLKALRQADLLVTTTRPLTPRQVAAVRHVRGVTASTVLATGVVRVDDRAVSAMGVDPSTFRPFTPRETARSDALWAAVARGDLAPSYATKLSLGKPVRLFRAKAVQSRIGAVAAYDLPASGLVLDRALAQSVGLPLNAMLIAAPERSLSRLTAEVRGVLGKATQVTELRPAEIVYRRPATYRELYQLSARYCPGLSWTVLAAIGQVESGHGRNVGPSSAGALGPMQFMPATWAAYAVDGDGDGKGDVMSAYDAVPAASLYLCRNGAGRGGQSLYDAIFAYNHADWYVRKVLDLAARYR